MAFRTFKIRLIRSGVLSEYTRHLEFEAPEMQHFGFVPGQWLSLRAENGDEEITRAYSLASAPEDGNQFAFCLNRVQDGFMSNYLCDLKPGEEVTASGPFGDFILRPPPRDTILIAAGTGIAPFRSMLHWLFADPVHHNGNNFWLLFGSRTEKDIYYHEEFQSLAAHHTNFSYIPTLSRGGTDWEGKRGYVQGHVREIVGDRKDMHAYICGLDKMVHANRELLKNLGWGRKSIRYEKYD